MKSSRPFIFFNEDMSQQDFKSLTAHVRSMVSMNGDLSFSESAMMDRMKRRRIQGLLRDRGSVGPSVSTTVHFHEPRVAHVNLVWTFCWQTGTVKYIRMYCNIIVYGVENT
ncbi:hypothetical protein FVEG_15407 [Fusarium verticillioides 7600]|uniref:Uncharacterized protein n=1 Tax=Gibberella moniliformis (strain M3125 / FGSC 7600) TaxID=334819 RepID=W7LSL2_GIBM7|nr:hypothetical protein FVEG_15407 [Fusarium verticillioides 7600]EWG42223.1 hypothetical protein FVEG_15407 [Fusarium verticillioides 7600]